MHVDLRRRAGQAGLGGKYHVLGCEVKLESLLPALASSGGMQLGDAKVITEMFDEIVCIRVLCGVPDPESVVAGLYNILKPGGRMVVCEHVVNSRDGRRGGTAVGQTMQQFYMMMGWSSIMGGCELTRDTLGSLRKAAQKDGGWEKVDVETYDAYSTIPHIVGVLTKKG